MRERGKRSKRYGRLIQRVDLLRKLEVVLGQATLRVGRDGHRDLVPRDLKVRVVVHLLGHRREAVDEVNRADEVVELELLRDRIARRLQPCRSASRLSISSSLNSGIYPPSAMRIASLVPSSTEMLYALGLGDSVVAVTHECDYPPDARDKPHLTRSVIPEGLGPAEIDAAVRERTGRGEALYELDEAALQELDPELIVTQAVCEVCAVSFDDVRAVADRLPSKPDVISLDPSTIGEVLADVPRLAEAARVRGSRLCVDGGGGRQARRGERCRGGCPASPGGRARMARPGVHRRALGPADDRARRRRGRAGPAR